MNKVLVLKAIASDHRLRMLGLLHDKEMAVFEISQAANLTFRTASKHLQRLESAGLIKRRQQAIYAYYSATDLGKSLIEIVGMIKEI